MSEEFYRRSSVTGRSYDVFKTIKILNVQQAAYYMYLGVELRDVKQSIDRKTKKPCLVFYFYRDETKDAYNLWCNREE